MSGKNINFHKKKKIKTRKWYKNKKSIPDRQR